MLPASVIPLEMRYGNHQNPISNLLNLQNQNSQIR